MLAAMMPLLPREILGFCNCNMIHIYPFRRHGAGIYLQGYTMVTYCQLPVSDGAERYRQTSSRPGCQTDGLRAAIGRPSVHRGAWQTI